MTGYTKLGRPLPAGCINEDTCLLDNGLKVTIGPPGKDPNVRSFSAEYAAVATPLWRYGVYLAVAAIVLSVSCCLFWKFYGTHRVNTYLNYPSTNCTVVSYTSTQDSKGNVYYEVQVSYVNAQNETKQYQMAVGLRDFNSNNWTTGAQFKCVYKGKFIEQYSVLETALSSVKSLWWVGFIIPFGASAVTGGIFLFTLIFIFRMGSKYYFPRTVTFNSDFVVSDWGHIPSNEHQMIYATMLGYHNTLGLTGDKNISFRRPKDSRINFTKGVLLGLGIFVSLIALGMLVFTGWCFYGYNMIMYGLGLYMVVMACYMGAVAIFSFRTFLTDKFAAEAISGSLSLVLMYSVQPNKISGTITKKQLPAYV